jgi:CMP-N-acetylneuraminic acid synthetase
MKILALVPARAGSKRIPKKNLRSLGNKPLFQWSIDSATGIDQICAILVSTDDPDIARLAVNLGAIVPWLRPEDLATDTASSVDVAIHSLDWYESTFGEVDGLLLLQPTSPFRKRETILEALRIFEQNNYTSLVSVTETDVHPEWIYRINDQKLIPIIESVGPHLRSQELKAAYALNGLIYLIKPNTLRKSRSFITQESFPLIVMAGSEVIDIDTEVDFKRAERFL